ncbi:hypothetical protein D9619_005153 [Psilocybe cf. subviscida]|uniref:Uncharacterized protein n=1 Tax=Psilocybe cf. subviscida TaxID=2480587 RepID=A0A8H5BRH6_9AGAR|nr:hypothetical protein D9619_005153 [Psilocybe cf. subviscida]
MSPGMASSSRLDAILLTVLVQTLSTGIYMLVFLQAFPKILRRTRKVYTTILVILFSLVITHLSANWSLLWAIFIVHNETRITMIEQSSKVHGQVALIGCIGAYFGLWLGDVILLWRCYVLWTQNKILLFVFATLMLGEVVFAAASRKIDTVLKVLMFISFSTTILATALIIYRIHQFSQHIGNGLGRYSATVLVLAESGALYAATQIAVCVLLVTHGTAYNSASTFQEISFWAGIVTPMAGIAPTLIALRISLGTALGPNNASQSVTSLQFNRSLPPAATVHTSFGAE